MNSKFKDRVINNNFRYIDWSDKKPSPKTFTSSDFNKIISGDKMFARKFDYELDKNIVDKIKKYIRGDLGNGGVK